MGSRGAKGPSLHARRVRHRPCGADKEVITVAHFHINMAGRARRIALEGSPRERKLLQFRRNGGAASGRGREWATDTNVRRMSARTKQMLARQVRAELRLVARRMTLGVVDIVPDAPAFRRGRYGRELI